MISRETIKSFFEELTKIQASWISIFIIVALFVCVTWWLAGLYFAGRIDSLEKNNTFLRDQLTHQTNKNIPDSLENKPWSFSSLTKDEKQKISTLLLSIKPKFGIGIGYDVHSKDLADSFLELFRTELKWESGFWEPPTNEWHPMKGVGLQIFPDNEVNRIIAKAIEKGTESRPEGKLIVEVVPSPYEKKEKNPFPEQEGGTVLCIGRKE